VASAAIDVSDGLTGDLAHILECSRVGATIDLARVPRSPLVTALIDSDRRDMGLACLLAGGDDYELCFTAAASRREALANIAREVHLPLARIGTVTAAPGLVVRDERGAALMPAPRSFDHFG
jgi:thiamine-monophosphate kinase